MGLILKATDYAYRVITGRKLMYVDAKPLEIVVQFPSCLGRQKWKQVERIRGPLMCEYHL